MHLKDSHYSERTIEPIDVIEAWDLGFNLGNVIKYIARADHKGQRESDLAKALNYLHREVHGTWFHSNQDEGGDRIDQHSSE